MKNNLSSGFTLIELMIYMVLATIVAFVSVSLTLNMFESIRTNQIRTDLGSFYQVLPRVSPCQSVFTALEAVSPARIDRASMTLQGTPLTVSEAQGISGTNGVILRTRTGSLINYPQYTFRLFYVASPDSFEVRFKATSGPFQVDGANLQNFGNHFNSFPQRYLIKLFGSTSACAFEA